MVKRFELTDSEWMRIEPLFPKRESKRGRPSKPARIMLNAVLWLAHTGVQWRELPDYYGSWKTVYTRFCKWRDDGTLVTIFSVLNADADMENLFERKLFYESKKLTDW